MPSSDRSETFGAHIVDRVLLIDIDQIDAGDRLRVVDPVWAQALGAVMRREGQHKPIEVCRLPDADRWMLVDGAHRLAGAKHAGLVYLQAIVVEADEQARRLREVSAQLHHRGLDDPFDRAAFIAELVQLKRVAAGLDATAQRDASVPHAKRVIAAEASEALATISNVYGWSDEVGAQLGYTGRTIRNDLLIYRRVAPSVIAQLRAAKHPVATNASQLRSLAKQPPFDQAMTVAKLIHRPSGVGDFPIKTVAQSLGATKAADPATKRLNAFLGSFGRMGLAERKGALALLVDLMPAGFKLVGAER